MNIKPKYNFTGIKNHTVITLLDNPGIQYNFIS